MFEYGTASCTPQRNPNRRSKSEEASERQYPSLGPVPLTDSKHAARGVPGRKARTHTQTARMEHALSSWHSIRVSLIILDERTCAQFSATPAEWTYAQRSLQ